MSLKVGIYVDHENIRLSDGADLDYSVLREYLSKGYDLLRCVIYVIVDDGQTKDLQERLYRYRDKLRYIGFKVSEKKKKKFLNPETGKEEYKANTDMELAIDVLREIENLDIVFIVSGDGDFVRLVEAVQSRGRKVVIVASSNVSKELKDAADGYIDAKTIPDIKRSRDAIDKE